MIRYALVCDHHHEFEAWFGASGDYDDQVARGLVECPRCNSQQVKKQIMAPAVTGTKSQKTLPTETAMPPEARAMMMEVMGKVRDYVQTNFEDVGDNFAREARNIHDGVSEERGIYGQATPKEVRELVEDGVPIAPLPLPIRSKAKLN